MATNPPVAPPVTENVLYVFIHGLISLVDIGDEGFNAYFLEIGPQHRYLFGDFLLEQEVRKRETGQSPLVLNLDGVDGQTVSPANRLNPNLNGIIQVQAAPSATADPVRALLHLPRPRNIYYFHCGPLPAGALHGNPSRIVGGKTPSTISGVSVFEYTFSSASGPSLTEEDPAKTAWKVPDNLARIGNRLVASLHFYDEPFNRMSEAEALRHNVEEMNLSLRFLGTNFRLAQTTGEARPLPPNSTQPDIKDLGILQGETGPLNRRRDFVRGMVFKQRCGQDMPMPGTGGGAICGGFHAQVV